MRSPLAVPSGRTPIAALLAGLALTLSTPAWSQSLKELYEAARAYDATYLSARSLAESAAFKAAQALIKSRALRGFQVRMQLAPGEKDKQLKVEMLIMTYPEQALQGSWNVKASGGKPESLIKAMVPKVIDDAAGDLNWKSP